MTTIIQNERISDEGNGKLGVDEVLNQQLEYGSKPSKAAVDIGGVQCDPTIENDELAPTLPKAGLPQKTLVALSSSDQTCSVGEVISIVDHSKQGERVTNDNEVVSDVNQSQSANSLSNLGVRVRNADMPVMRSSTSDLASDMHHPDEFRSSTVTLAGGVQVTVAFLEDKITERGLTNFRPLRDCSFHWIVKVNPLQPTEISLELQLSSSDLPHFVPGLSPTVQVLPNKERTLRTQDIIMQMKTPPG
jgi:hypothetical protein